MEKELDSTILGKLLLIQSTLHVMPDEEKRTSFLIQGLSRFPGIDATAFCVNGKCYYSDADRFEKRLRNCEKCSDAPAENRVEHNAGKGYCPFTGEREYRCLGIRTSSSVYGCCVIHISDESAFLLYMPFIENTINLLALLTENRMQHFVLESNREALEKEVERRTVELTEEVVERKKTELLLRAREEELSERNRFIETIINLNPDILYIYDIVERKNVYSNDGVERVLGYSTQEVRDMGDQLIGLLMHSDDFQRYLQNTLKRYITAADGEIINHQYRMQHKDGNWRWLSSREVIYKRLIDGAPHQILGVIHDITDIKRAEEMLIESQDRIRQIEKMQAIGQLAGGIAHDFNNQLAGVVGYVDLLRESFIENPQIVNYTDKILQTTGRAADLTAQLLAFARKGKYLATAVDMHRIIGEVVGILQRTVDKKITLSSRLEAERPVVSGDPTQLQNILMNLALNARDAMPDGGRMVFETVNEQLDSGFCDNIAFEIHPGEYLKVAVSDNGSGMSDETRKKIFEPFFTTKQQGKGTGMGLASVYGAVKNHNGAITVQSAPGEGSVMTVYLPVGGILETVVVESPERYTYTSGGGVTVLVVDDEEYLLEIAGSVLQRNGYSILVANNGKEAIEVFTKAEPPVGLVLLDMIMPDKNGKEVFFEIRKQNPEVPVLISSGYAINDEVRELIKSGAGGFIQKPFRSEELLSRVAALLKVNTTEKQ